MNRQDRGDLIARLARHESEHPLVSIYLPVALAPDERRQNEIRLGNLEREARRQLEGCGLASREIDGLLACFDGDALEQRVWDRHSPGFAIFTDGDLYECIGLPCEVAETVRVGPRFYLKPLLATHGRGLDYHLLTLSLGKVALYRGDAGGLERVELGDSVPTSLTDVTGADLTDAQLQFHPGDRGSDEAIYHGHGSGKDDSDPETDRFLRKLDEALDDYFREHDAPILLAGVDELTARYRRLADAREFVDEPLSGNVEDHEPEALHELAWPLIEARIERQRQAELEALRERADDRPVCSDFDEIMVAAVDGRVDTLFVAADSDVWGRYDPAARKVETRDEALAGDDDLLNRAAIESYLADGRTHVIRAEELPADTCAIARFRY